MCIKARHLHCTTINISNIMTAVREFSEDDINKSTENFSPSRELGHGGFGTVYKGYINGTNIAVKVLSEASECDAVVVCT